MKRVCFWRFVLNNCVPAYKTSVFIKLTSFKVLIVKFQASTSDQCHHLLINPSCKSSSKPLKIVSARSVVCFLQPILLLTKTSSRPTLRLRFSYCIYTLRTYTNTARSIEAAQRLCSEAMTSDEVGFLLNFRTFKVSPSHLINYYYDVIICLKQLRCAIIKIPNDWKLVVPRPGFAQFKTCRRR